jgi:phosphoribosyl 1,2-cyclic phosphate phosphodiesterase
MPVYGTQHTLDQLKVEYAYVFDKETYPGIPRLQLNLISDQSFTINGVVVTPLPVLHLRMPVLGFRFQDFSYITDANFIPDSTLEKLVGTKVLVLNALQVDPHLSHFNLNEALKMVDRIQPEKTYFTHISHKLGLHASIEKGLPSNVSLAFDGLEIAFDH